MYKIDKINNKVLLYNTGNYIQYPVITIIEKNMKKEFYIYIYSNHFAVHLKLTQHCKSPILQFKKKRNTNMILINGYAYFVILD